MNLDKNTEPLTSQIIDNLEYLNNNVSSSAVSWWESKRIWFNALVGISGILGILSHFSYLSILDIILIVIWGILANLLYSTGMTIELLDGYYFNYSNNLRQFRWLFFAIGTSTYSILTFWYANTYFLLALKD